MLCSKCGNQCTDGAKFCNSCGTALVQATLKNVAAEEVTVTKNEEAHAAVPVAPAKVEGTKEKKPVNMEFIKGLVMKKPVWIVAAVAVLLIVFSCFFLQKNGEVSNYVTYTDKSVYEFVNVDVDGKVVPTVTFLDGSKIEIEDENGGWNELGVSTDRSGACYLNESNELVIIKNGKLIMTGIDDVESFRISKWGDTIAFYSDVEKISYKDDFGFNEYAQVGTLNLYVIDEKKSYQLAEEVLLESEVLSPNGMTVAFISEFDSTDEFVGFYCEVGKKPVEIGKGKEPVTLADKGVYLYYVEGEYVFVQKGKDDSEKLAGMDEFIDLYFNKDCTEVMYEYDDKTYISVRGGKKKKIFNEKLDVICSESVARDVKVWRNSDVDSYIIGLDSFSEKLFCYEYGDEMWYLDKDYNPKKIVSDLNEFDYYKCSSDYKSLLYVKDDAIWKVTDFEEGGRKEKLYKSERLEKVWAGENLEHIYFSEQLEDSSWGCDFFYLNGKKGKKIADTDNGVVSSDGKYYYYLESDEDGNEILYCSTKGGKGVEIARVDNINSITRKYGYMFMEVQTDDIETTYSLKGTKKTELYSRERVGW